MHYWTQRSFELATEPGYLDRLFSVYPMRENMVRELPPEMIEKIRGALGSGNHAELIKILLRLERFPIKDSYISYLRHNPAAIDANPATTQRIGAVLEGLGFEKIIDLATTPKETNTQIGPMFGQWLRRLGYPAYNEEAFLASTQGIALLHGTDKTLTAFINRYFGASLQKGLDLVIKINGRTIIGEAKFLTAYGGHQNGQFNEAMALLDQNIHGVLTVAVLDGVIWLDNEQRMNRGLKASSGCAISALLLPEFIENLQAAS